MSTHDKAPDGSEWLPVGEVPTTQWAWMRSRRGVEAVRLAAQSREDVSFWVLNGRRFAPVADVAALQARLAEVERERDAYRADLAAAAGELPVRVPAPNTDTARLLWANVTLRHERRELRAENDVLRERAASLTEDVRACAGLVALFEERHRDDDGRWPQQYIDAEAAVRRALTEASDAT